MRKKLRVGIVGSGWVAQHRHIPCWRKVGAEIISVCTLDPPAPTATRLKVAHVTSHLEDLIAQRLDVVSVCSPPQFHFEHAKQLVEQGIPVLLEKPLVTTIAEAEALRDIVERSAVPVCPAYSFRFCRAVRRAWHLLASGVAGEIIQVIAVQSSSFSRRLPTWFADLPGGLYWDEGQHLIYLVNAFIDDAALVSSRLTWNGSTTPVTVSAELVGKRGGGSLHVVFGGSLSEWHLVIVTTRGIIDVDLFRDICVVLPPDGGHGSAEAARASVYVVTQHLVGLAASAWKHLRGQLYYGHDELIRRFAERLEPPVDLVREGLHTVYLADAILRGDVTWNSRRVVMEGARPQSIDMAAADDATRGAEPRQGSHEGKDRCLNYESAL